MSCANFITQPACVLPDNTAIAEAVAKLSAAGFSPLPVVDGDGRLAGIFGPRQLATLMLPMGARLAGDTFDLGFVSEPLADLRARLAATQDGVRSYLGEHLPIHPTTSVDEVLLRLHRGESFLVVVDDDRRVVGVVTADRALAYVLEG
jgi:CBS domain-containing protein